MHRRASQSAGFSFVLILVWSLFSLTARAATPAFQSLTQDDVDKIEREMLANTTMHSVLPPSSLGSIFGFEVGVVGGITRSPEITNEVHRVNSSTDVPAIPHAGLVGAVTIPGGLTVEAQYLPKMTMSDLTYQQYALALKWTLTDTGLMAFLPINIAIRGMYARSELTFNQNVNDSLLGTVSVGVTNTGRVTGGQLLVSPKLIPIIEPYFGVGYLSASGSLSQSVATTPSIFTSSVTSMDSSPTSTQIIAGLDAKLFFVLGFGLEYSRAFNTDSYTGKLSFKF